VGGRGSGRTASYRGRDITEDSLPLDIRRLQLKGVLVPGRSVSWQWTVNDQVRASIGIRVEAGNIALSYNYTPHDKPTEAIRQTVWIESTACTLGGRRRWFACPACNRRVAVIYGAGRLFACRQCKGLAYGSQSETAVDRAFRRTDGIRKKLGWLPGIANGSGGKPKGMHWSTYQRLTAEHDLLLAATLDGMKRQLGLVATLLGDARAHLDQVR